jgi:hypothetical protein
MTRNLFRIFIGATGVGVGLGIANGYSWDLVITGALAMGLYLPLSIVSIATWRESRGKDPEDMVGVFGTEASEIIPSFYDIYRNNKWLIFGASGLVGLGCGGGLGLWFRLQLPGAWGHDPVLLSIFMVGFTLCGALAGSGLALTGLFLLKGDRESGMAGA